MTDMTDTTTASRRAPARVSRTVHVAAPPAAVFALLSDPANHAELDGSGTVKGLLRGPTRLELGSVFRMQMKGYRTTNTVVAHQQDALLAWRHRGRHVWRWELRTAGSGTEVTETFDYSAKRARPVVELLGIPSRAATAIEQTLTVLRTRFDN